MFTLLPSVLAELPAPLCRSCRNVLRKACSAVVSAGGEPAGEVPVPVDPVAAAVAAAAPELVVGAPEVVPPKSPISLVNAAFRLDTVLDDRFEGVPVAADDVPMTWLLLKSLMSAVSSAAMPCRPYRCAALLFPEGVATGVVVTGVVVTGVAATGVEVEAVAAVGVVTGVVAASVPVPVPVPELVPAVVPVVAVLVVGLLVVTGVVTGVLPAEMG